MTTMRDVAGVAGVSAKTVSRVLNGDPHVLPATRARVEAAMRDLEYVPNALATTFRSGRSPVVGVAVPDIVDPFFASIVRAVERTARAHDMSVLVTSLGDDPAREPALLDALLRRQLSGLVVAPIGNDHSALRPWAARTPVVFVDRPPGRLPADSFTQDDAAGARAATAHLLEHGHERIAFLGDTLALPTTAARLDGHRAALAAAGAPEHDELVVLDRGEPSAAASAVAALRRLPRPPTALLSSNARSTMAILPALDADPLALVAFGDFPLADRLRPALTVIAQDPEALGRLAAERVFDRIEHPGRRHRRRTVLPVRLIERESCALSP